MKPEYIRDDLASCLAHLTEECGELVAACGKAQRFGLHCVNPEVPPSKQETNLRWILREIGDVEGAIGRFKQAVEREF